MKKKIAIVNQRYGLEVNGGSEQYTRMLAEKLASLSCFDIEVLTTCALEYTTWENHYPEGAQLVEHVKVLRFKVEKPRNQEYFNSLNLRILTSEHGDRNVENEWIDAQGPYCPALIEHIRKNKDKYDIFIFVTYLYYLTARGISEVADKALLLPTAHDEPYIHFGVYRDVFLKPKAILFLTEEEKELVHGIFKNGHIPYEVIGAGIEVPGKTDPEAFKEKYNLQDYFVYVGRIDEGKACDRLFENFIRYKKQNKNNCKLVLMGKAAMKIPKHPDIVSLGFVSEEDKYNGIAGAKMLILPSFYESLSISVLESMALGVPVVVNCECEVLKGHCVKSNAGLYYKDYYEFEGCINYLLAHSDTYAAMRDNAREYIQRYYRWDAIIGRIKAMIEKV